MISDWILLAGDETRFQGTVVFGCHNSTSQNFLIRVFQFTGCGSDRGKVEVRVGVELASSWSCLKHPK